MTYQFYLLYATTPIARIKSALASWKKEVLRVSGAQACSGDYLQINGFLASNGRVEKNPLQLKATENQ